MSKGCLPALCYNTSRRRPSTPPLQHIPAPLDAVEGALEGDDLSILRALRSRALGGPPSVYLVGGPVRDILLGAPIKDLDFVIEGDAPETAQGLAAELGGRVLSHARFGTATLALGDARVDLVTARKEVYSRPAALPEVSPGTIHDDLARRDFSINALALPLGETHPEVLDPHGGVGDLERGLVRVLHQGSFVDDPTRILRAVRYEQRLGFRIEDGTLSRLRDAVAGGRLAALTGDRLRHELERILQEDRPWLALRRALGLGILAAIHPSLGNGKAKARLEAVAALDSGGDGPLTYVAALAYPLTAEEGEAVIRRLNMPNSWARAVRDTLELRGREAELTAPSLPRSGLHRLAHGLCPEAVLAVSRMAGSPVVVRRLVEYLDELRFVTPALNGRDLLDLGVPDGPMVGQVLRMLQEARLDQKVSSEAEERRLVREILSREGGGSRGG